MFRKALVWAFALGAPAAAGLATANVLMGNDGPKPGEATLAQLSQQSEATDRGIRVAAKSAFFSGTETLLTLDILVVDEGEAAGARAGHQVKAILPAPDGFDSSGFSGQALEAHVGDGGLVAVRLPAVAPPQPYAGTVELTLLALVLRTDAGEIRAAGEWRLSLVGPTDLSAALRTESFAPAQVAVSGHQLNLRGIRSTSETRIEVSNLNGLQLLSQPAIGAGQERSYAIRVDPTLSGYSIQFEPTEFGSVSSVWLGPLGTDAGTSAPVPLVIDVKAALARAPADKDGKFAIGAEDVIAGDAKMVLSGFLGSRGTRGEELGVTVKGNWRAVEGSPAILGPDGTPLRRAGVITSFSKNAAGDVLPGKTEITAFIPGGIPTSVTLVLGGPVEVLQSQPVELRPER
ncbi:MAG: hypothetical protein IT304_02675 [Dehalococcoidia bacterium]|nr:hypothetical protein [Dehalococcoidia bacterium]